MVQIQQSCSPFRALASSGAGLLGLSCPAPLVPLCEQVGPGCQASAWLSSTSTVRGLALLSNAEQLMPAGQLSGKGVQPRWQGLTSRDASFRMAQALLPSCRSAPGTAPAGQPSRAGMGDQQR